jgi:hypothetical protein
VFLPAKPLVENPSSSGLIEGKKQTLAQQFPELYSYSINTQATAENILSTAENILSTETS